MIIEGVKIEIVRDNSIGSTPAKVRIVEPHKKAIVFLSDKIDGYPKATQRFILLHEVGHAVLNSGDEMAVDRWAFHQFISSGGSPAAAVFALSKVLDPIHSADHEERTVRQFYRAKHAQFLKGKLSYKKFQKLNICF